MLITFAKKCLYDQVGNKEDFSSRSIQGRLLFFFWRYQMLWSEVCGAATGRWSWDLRKYHLVTVRSVTVGDERRPNQRSLSQISSQTVVISLWNLLTCKAWSKSFPRRRRNGCLVPALLSLTTFLPISNAFKYTEIKLRIPSLELKLESLSLKVEAHHRGEPAVISDRLITALASPYMVWEQAMLAAWNSFCQSGCNAWPRCLCTPPTSWS